MRHADACANPLRPLRRRAVTIHGATRATKDIDILIAAADLDKAIEAVRALGYKFAALPQIFYSRLGEIGGG